MTSEWHEVPLRELVGYISKGIAPSYAEEASETTIRVLNQKCNRNFRISYGDSRLHDTLKKKVPPERYVKPDDILINSTGAGTAGRIAQIEDVPSATTIDGHMILSPTQSTGRAAAVSDALLARYDKGMVCTNFCKALKPRAGYSMYVYYYWQYLYDRDIFFSYENGTTGIKNLDINGFIETEPIVIAPEDLVEKFDAVCQTVFSKIYANGMENEQLALVRDTILPKLMSGEIDDSAVQL